MLSLSGCAGAPGIDCHGTQWYRLGYEDGLNFGGGSMAIDPFGRTIASLPALDEGLAVAELSPEVLRRARTVYPLLLAPGITVRFASFNEAVEFRSPVKMDLLENRGQVGRSDHIAALFDEISVTAVTEANVTNRIAENF